MAAKRSATPPHSATERSTRSDKQRQLIASCLVRAISEKGGTNVAAARWLGVAQRTLHSWVHCERPISVETVLACAQLRDGFRRALCTFDHEPGSAPYIAKKGAR